MRTRRYIDKLVRHDIVVHTKSEGSFHGILVDTYRDCLVLAQARLLRDGGDPLLLEGDTVIPRENVAFIQTP